MTTTSVGQIRQAMGQNFSEQPLNLACPSECGEALMRGNAQKAHEGAPALTAERPWSILEYYCAVPGRRTGKPCRHRAGYGTDHFGDGPCALHGGLTWQAPWQSPEEHLAMLDAAVAAADAERARRAPQTVAQMLVDEHAERMARAASVAEQLASAGVTLSIANGRLTVTPDPYSLPRALRRALRDSSCEIAEMLATTATTTVEVAHV